MILTGAGEAGHSQPSLMPLGIFRPNFSVSKIVGSPKLLSAFSGFMSAAARLLLQSLLFG